MAMPEAAMYENSKYYGLRLKYLVCLGGESAMAKLNLKVE